MAQVAVAAVGLQAAASVYGGYQEKKLADDRANAYYDAARRRRSSMTREIYEADRERKFMAGRAKAIAAASGAGVDTPGMTRVLGDLNAEGSYRVMAKMWQGLDDSQALIEAGNAAREEGDAAWNAGMIGGVTSVLSGAAYFGWGGGMPNRTLPPPSAASAGAAASGATRAQSRMGSIPGVIAAGVDE